jgi:hypothetical protein
MSRLARAEQGCRRRCWRAVPDGTDVDVLAERRLDDDTKTVRDLALEIFQKVGARREVSGCLDLDAEGLRMVLDTGDAPPPSNGSKTQAATGPATQQNSPAPPITNHDECSPPHTDPSS